jgi:hypothetical protein
VEPVSHKLRILTQGSLIVVLSIELDFKLCPTPHKGLSPVLADWVVVTLSEQGISHIFDNSKAGQKSLRVKVEHMLDNNVLLS